MGRQLSERTTERTGAAPSVRVSMLGRFAVSIDGRTVDEQRWKLRKAKQLVKLLGLAPGQRMEKDRLLDLLWPELDPAAADNSFRQTVFVARRALDPIDGQQLFQRVDDAIELWTGGRLWTDVDAFREHAARARGSGTIADHEAALAAYGGDLLPEDSYEDWGAAPREELRALRIVLMLDIAELYRTAGRIDDAIGMLEQLIGLQPANEAAHVSLMRIHAAAGQRRRAMRQYEVLAEALTRELDASPERATRELYDRILADHPTPASGLLRPARHRHNLPAQLTTFIGRASQIERISSALAGSRLVTLVGPPGTGKTRLALAVAERMLDSYHHGVWIVDAGTLEDVAQLPDAIGQAIGEAPGGRLEALVERARDRELLLVLDACERLVPDVGVLLSELLGSCPRVRVLVTSRETLRVAGEVVLDVPPLALPDARDSLEVERALMYEAVRLFVDRAAVARPGIVVTSRDLPHVIEICRRLDGLPLAIELAAAQLRALSLAQVATRLDRTAASPQRRLVAALDASHQQLRPAERVTFRRLAVFRGGFDLEAVEAIAPDGELPVEHVTDAIWRLVDKSLVRAGAGDDGRIRFTLLDSIKEYANRRMDEAGERHMLQERHAGHYLDLAETAAAEVDDERSTEQYLELGHGHDEIIGALAFLIQTEDAERALRLIAAVWRSWVYRADLAEGYRVARAVLALPGASAPSAPRAYALMAAGALATDLVAPDARQLLDAAVAAFREIRDERGLGRALLRAFTLAILDGRSEEAAVIERDGLALARGLGDPIDLALWLTNAADLARRSGDLGRARMQYSEAVDLLASARHHPGLARAHFGAATVEHLAGDLHDARRRYELSLAAAIEADEAAFPAYVRANMAALAVEEGDVAGARALSAAAFETLLEVNDGVAQLFALEDIAAIAAAVGASERACALAAAVAEERARVSVSRPPVRQRQQERWLGELRRSLGSDRVEELWQRGTARDLEWAIGEARSVLATVKAAPA